MWETSLVTGTQKHESVEKRISLKMVADKVGLSTAAVSRVLNGSPAAKSIPAARRAHHCCSEQGPL